MIGLGRVDFMWSLECPPAVCCSDSANTHNPFPRFAPFTQQKRFARSNGFLISSSRGDSMWMLECPSALAALLSKESFTSAGTHNPRAPLAFSSFPKRIILRHALSPSQPKRGLCPARATVEQPSSPAQVDAKATKISFFPTVLGLPASLWRQLTNPLSNFGFGKRSVWEGGVGIFIISGAVLFTLTVGWLKGYQVRSRTQKYQAVIQFSKANGICVGTPVRIRGVDVGNVVSVKSSLDSIDVVIQILDAKIVIPRGSLVEVNQSGLLMDTLIDVTPPNQLPQPTVGPLDPRCSEEGMIVCDRQRLKGEQGVNLDELVGLFTRLAKEVDQIGISQIYSLADRVGKTVEDAKPLLSKVTTLVGELEPLLKDVQNGGLLKELEVLLKVLNDASGDLRMLNDSVLTPENRELLRQSVMTLTKTLKNVESISGDVSGITGDAATRHNLKHLVESLSRLLAN
ncbi:hypothetical protein GOP47_0010970 [Adiantum capillus-veneris]|uniref:Mce/MlaD domain-containing protein n=2 Tax=Adiantum capillus-veneris TaxID=13818 RepID=A0A9D4ZGW7_ADICA|nr:hypothetical protein GOP47_0010970 [Adiantum capillus-veneris]